VVVEEETPKRRRRSRGSVKFKADQATSQAETTLVESEVVVHAPFGATSESIEAEVTEEKQPEKPKRVRKPRKTKAEKKAEEAADANEKTVEVVGVEAAPVEKPVRKRKPKIAQKKTLGGVKVESDLKVTVAQEPTIDRVVEVQPKVVTETKAPEPVDTPKKRGWWSRG
jgi:ribonuclease E